MGISTRALQLVPLLLTLWHLPPLEAAPLQIIITFAGSGALGPGDAGDGGLATSALLQAPVGLAINASGAVYISDPPSNRVRVVTPDGVISAVAGSGTAGAAGDFGAATFAQLHGPYGLAVHTATGALFIADQSNHAVRRVGLDGIITTVAGRHGVRGYSGDGFNATFALLSSPQGLAVNSLTGDLLIADSGNNAIRMVTYMTGVISAVAGTGIGGYSGNGGPAVLAQLNFPCGVAMDVHTGTIYVADTSNHRVRQVVNGTISLCAGNGDKNKAGDGGPATLASLWQPGGVYVSAAKTLYISDTGNSAVRYIDANGLIFTVAGNKSRGFWGDGGSAVDAELAFPNNVAVVAGTVFIADTFNAIVRRVDNAMSPPPIPPHPLLLPVRPPVTPEALPSPPMLPPRPPSALLTPVSTASPPSLAPHKKASSGALIGGATAGGICFAAVLALAVWWRLRSSLSGCSEEPASKGALQVTPSALKGAVSGGEHSRASLWSPNLSYLSPGSSATLTTDRDAFGPLISPHLGSASQISTWGASFDMRVGVSAMPNLPHMQPSWVAPPAASPPSTWGDTAGVHIGVAAVMNGAQMQAGWARSQPPASPSTSWGPAFAKARAGGVTPPVNMSPLQTNWSSPLSSYNTRQSTWDASQSSSLGSGLLGMPNIARNSLDSSQTNEPGASAMLERRAGSLGHTEGLSPGGGSKEKREGGESPEKPPDASTKLQARLVGLAGGSPRSQLPSPSVAKKMNVEGVQWTQGKLVDRGGSGRVYVGHDLNGALIAIKVQPLPSGADALRLELLLGEISALQSLKHNNVVEYLGSAMDDQNLYIFMAYEPQSLAMVLKDGLEEVVVRKYTRQILQGLEYVHGQGVAHRDVKAANLQVDRDGIIKLTDFGSAKMHRHAEHNSTIQINSIAGTPHWMSPEICLAAMGQGGGYSGTKADVWSLGVTVVEMMMGGHPWCKMEGLKAIWTVVHGEDGLPRPAHASPMAMDFMDQCMQRDPAKRATIAQLLLHPFVAIPDEAQSGVVRRPFPHTASSAASSPTVSAQRQAVRALSKTRSPSSRLSSPTGDHLASIPTSHITVSGTPVDGTAASSPSRGEATAPRGNSTAATVDSTKSSSQSTQVADATLATIPSSGAPTSMLTDERGNAASASGQPPNPAAPAATGPPPAAAPSTGAANSRPHPLGLSHQLAPSHLLPRVPAAGLSSLMSNSNISASESDLLWHATGSAGSAAFAGWEGPGSDRHFVPLSRTS